MNRYVIFHSQGVGDYYLKTKNVNLVQEFRKILWEYKNFIKNEDPEDLEKWEFYEYITIVFEDEYNKYDSNDVINCAKIHYSYYTGDFTLIDIDNLLIMSPERIDELRKIAMNKIIEMYYSEIEEGKFDYVQSNVTGERDISVHKLFTIF